MEEPDLDRHIIVLNKIKENLRKTPETVKKYRFFIISVLVAIFIIIVTAIVIYCIVKKRRNLPK